MDIFQRWRQTALHNKALVIITFFSLLSAIAYCVTACVQAHYMGESVDQAQAGLNASINASRVDQRAWVDVESAAAIPTIPEAGKEYKIVLQIQNFGKTPAKKAYVTCKWEVLPTGKIPDFIYDPGYKKSLGVIPPTAYDLLPSQIGGPVINADQINAIASQRVQVFIHGVITYEDIFRQNHWSTFCFILEVPFNGACTKATDHNDTDD